MDPTPEIAEIAGDAEPSRDRCEVVAEIELAEIMICESRLERLEVRDCARLPSRLPSRLPEAASGPGLAEPRPRLPSTFPEAASGPGLAEPRPRLPSRLPDAPCSAVSGGAASLFCPPPSPPPAG